jgi:predicted MPP superfamily phosphohydrolase
MFFLIFLSVMALLNVYVYRRLFRKINFNLDKLGLPLLVVLFLLQITFVLEARTHFLPDSPEIYYVLSMSVGITVILFFITLLYDLLHTVGKRIPYDESRRYFIKVIFDVSMIVLAASYLLNGIFGALRRPAMNDISVGIKGLGFEHFKIAQLSDMHIGRTIGAEFVRECVERVNAQQPDMVVLTGDIVDLPVNMIEEALFELTKLKSTFGTFFIMGNHEYFRGPEAVVEHIKGLGITVLLNESRTIGDSETAFNLVGINDLVSKRMGVMPYDVEAAFGDVDPELPTIVLAHQPKSVTVTQHKAFDLMLSGHTHGGQIFPFGFLVMLDQPFLAGLYDVDDTKQIFVSRGTGYWGPPVRVLAPSEISLLNLYPA